MEEQNLTKEFLEQIEEICKNKGISFDDVMAKSGISLGIPGYVKQGKYELSMDSIKRIAKQLGLSVKITITF